MMAKLAFLAAVFAALIHSSIQIKCYFCKEKDLYSSVPAANDLSLCGKTDASEWPVKSTVDLNCKKLVEKVADGGKETTNVLRFPGPKEMKDLNKEVITEYTCNTDLCNEADSLGTSAVIVPLSLTVAFFRF